jgi:DNA-binding transcriptional regulator YhcF (GntR family)
MLNLRVDSTAGAPLVEQLVTGVRQHIEARLLRAGARLPSIRSLAAQQQVSRFTVVEAYDRLVATGHVESRRGSGFYVAARAVPETGADRTGSLERAVDVATLIAELCSDEARALFAQDRLFAGGCLPNDWQEESGIRRHARLVASQGPELTDFGTKLGYPPLPVLKPPRGAQLCIAVYPAHALTTKLPKHPQEP